MSETFVEPWAFALRRHSQRLLHSRRAPWAALALGVVAALAALGMALLALRHSAAEEQALAASAESLRTQIEAAARVASGATRAEPPADFVRGRLPGTPDVRPLLSELERSTASAGVALGSVQLQERAATAEQLARADVTASLRGSYPNLKRVVADVLGRYPNATLVQWRLRRATQPGDVESTMVLALWGAAVAAEPGSLAASAAGR